MTTPNPRARTTTPASKPKPLKNPSATRPTPKPRPKSTPSAPSKPAGSSARPVPRHAPAATKAATTTPASKPTQQIPQGNWLSRAVQDKIAGVGNYAGSYFTGIGDTVNKVGEGIGNKVSDTTRYWGQGVSGYGNDIKDKVGVGGPRIATGGNPLGLAGVGQGKTTMKGSKPQGGVRTAGKGTGVNPLGI